MAADHQGWFDLVSGHARSQIAHVLRGQERWQAELSQLFGEWYVEITIE